MSGFLMKDRHPDVFDDVLKRMRRIEGQARGIQRMIQDGEDCENVLLQISAMRAALHRVGLKVVGCHLSSRIKEELEQGGTGQTAVEEALETFMRLG